MAAAATVGSPSTPSAQPRMISAQPIQNAKPCSAEKRPASSARRTHRGDVTLELAQPGVERQGQRQRERVTERPCPVDGAVAHRVGLGGAPLQPQRPGGVRPAGDPGVGDVVERRAVPAAAALLGVGGDGMLQGPERLGQSSPRYTRTQPAARLAATVSWRLFRPGSERAEPIGDVEGDVVLGAQEVHPEDPVQRLEQLGHVAERVAEGEGSPIDVLDLGRAIATGGHQRCTEADEEGRAPARRGLGPREARE